MVKRKEEERKFWQSASSPHIYLLKTRGRGVLMTYPRRVMLRSGWSRIERVWGEEYDTRGYVGIYLQRALSIASSHKSLPTTL
jgi:hypothetical protein